jgi:hypothetical protein
MEKEVVKRVKLINLVGGLELIYRGDKFSLVSNTEEKLTKLKELLAVLGSDGNWNYDDYMRGMYNGMELAVATFEGRPPVYREHPVKEDDELNQ